MSQQYYLRYRGRVRGPFSLENLRQLKDEGRLPQDIEIGEGQDELFYPYESLAYLFQPASAPAPAVRRPAVQRPAPAPGRAPRDEPPEEGRVEESRTAKHWSDQGRSLAGPALIGALGTLALAMAALTDEWVDLDGTHKVASGDPILLKVRLGLAGASLTSDAGKARVTPKEKRLLGEVARRTWSYKDIPSPLPDILRGSWLDRIGREAWDQTKLFAVGIPVLIGLGAAIVLGAGFGATIFRGSLGSALAVVSGLAGLASVVGLGYAGAAVAAEKSAPAPGVVLGTSFQLGIAAAALIFLGGVLLAGTGQRRSPPGRRVFG